MSTFALLALSRSLHGVTTLEEVVGRVRTALRESTRYDKVFIHLIAEGGKRMEIVGAVFSDQEYQRVQVAEIDVANDRMLQRSLRAHDPYVVPDLRLDADADQEKVARFGNRTAIVVPMFEGDARIGPLIVPTFADQGVMLPTPEELDFIVQVASVVSVVIGRLRAEQARRLAEEQVAATERMQALGRMAGEIAHDINNVLVSIMAGTELASLELGAHPVTHYLDGVQQAAVRVSELTRQLLSYARGQVLDKQPVDVEAVLAAVDRLVRPTLGAEVELRLDVAPAIGSIYADRVQLERVLLNLLTNARDALSGRGVITLTAERVTVDADTVASQGKLVPGRYLRVSVSDDGAGMSRETQAHIFEPFFTTKSGHRGTGLGLAVVDGVVRQHDGAVHVYSELGHGTTFRVYLPVKESELAQSSPEPTDEGRELRGGERILVVDDDESVRTAVREVLERSSCEVLHCGGVAEALELLGAHGFDLLLTDVVLQDGSGVELAQRARDAKPGLPVLFMTGFARGKLAELSAPHLTKPFGGSELLRQLRRALARG